MRSARAVSQKGGPRVVEPTQAALRFFQMLMSNGGRQARLHYLSSSFRVLSAGDYVLCAVTGQQIPLDRLRYWSAERPEAYASADASAKRGTRPEDSRVGEWVVE